MIFKTIFFTATLSLGKRVDFLHDRGVLVENQTDKDAVFYSQIERDSYYLRFSVPEFHSDFSFRDGCNNIKNSHGSSDNVTTLNAKFQLMLQDRIKRFFHGYVENGVHHPSEATDKEIKEIYKNEKYDYIPRELFQVSNERFRDIPIHIGQARSIIPLTTSSSQLEPRLRKNFPNNLYDNRTQTYIGFDCTHTTAHEIRFTIREPIQFISLIIKGPLGEARGASRFDFNFELSQPTFQIVMWYCQDMKISKPTTIHHLLGPAERMSPGPHYRACASKGKPKVQLSNP